MNLSDELALKRTQLANERTLLAYIRTGVVLLSAGFAIIQIKALNEISELGIGLVIIAPLIIAFGTYRYKKVAKMLDLHE